MKRSIVSVCAALLALLLAAGCSDDDGTTPEPTQPLQIMYQVTVTNLSNDQPLTPLAVVLHGGAYRPWQLGQSASAGLEVLAESGSPADFLQEAKAESDVVAVAMSEKKIDPGTGDLVTVQGDMDKSIKISVASMLANTNDAFTGINAMAVGDLKVGESITVLAHAYDAGTEANSESAGSIPGPADEGAGYDAARDDVDFVSVHAGVVSKDDGLAQSVLTEAHRWTGPVAKVMITRMQ